MKKCPTPLVMLAALFALSVVAPEASASPLASKVRRMREVKEAKAQEETKSARAMLAAPEEGPRKHRAVRARTGGSAMASPRMR